MALIPFPNPINFSSSGNKKPHKRKKGPSNPTRAPTPNTNIWNLPASTTTERTTTTTTTRRAWTTKAPFYNPSNPSYNGGGSYYGNRYGDDSNFGGSSFTRPTTRYTTRRPASSGSSSGGFFSGLSNVLSGDVGKFIESALSNRGGSSGGGNSFGGFGSFFGGGDTRPSVDTRNYRGGLFSENTGTGGSTSNHNAYPVTRIGEAPQPSSNPTPSHGNFGWKLS